MVGKLVIGGSVEDLSVVQVLVVGGRWVGGGPVGGSVVGGLWNGGEPVGRSVVGGRWPVDGRWFAIRFSFASKKVQGSSSDRKILMLL